MDNFLFVFCLLFFSHGQLFSTRGPTIPGGHFCFACLPTTFSPFPATLPVTIIRRHLSNNPLSWWTFMLSSHLFQHFGEPFCSLMTLSPFSAIIFIYFALQQCFRSFSGTFSRNHSCCRCPLLELRQPFQLESPLFNSSKADLFISAHHLHAHPCA